MANVRQLKDHGTPIFPITHVSLVKGMEGRALMDATYAWDGTGTPDVSKIPAGVVVTYNGTDYTGTLVASASTTGRFYLVPSTTVQGEWDRYMTDGTGSSYAWKAAGNTSIPSPDVVDNETTDDSTKSHSAAGGKRLKDQLGELEAKVTDLQESVNQDLGFEVESFTYDAAGEKEAYIKPATYVVTNTGNRQITVSFRKTQSGTSYNVTTLVIGATAEITSEDTYHWIRCGGAGSFTIKKKVNVVDYVEETRKGLANEDARIKQLVSGDAKTFVFASADQQEFPTEIGTQYKITNTGNSAVTISFRETKSGTSYNTTQFVVGQSGFVTSSIKGNWIRCGDAGSFTIEATNLEARATNLEARATNLEARATNLEARATNLEASMLLALDITPVSGYGVNYTDGTLVANAAMSYVELTGIEDYVYIRFSGTRSGAGLGYGFFVNDVWQGYVIDAGAFVREVKLAVPTGATRALISWNNTLVTEQAVSVLRKDALQYINDKIDNTTPGGDFSKLEGWIPKDVALLDNKGILLSDGSFQSSTNYTSVEIDVANIDIAKIRFCRTYAGASNATYAFGSNGVFTCERYTNQTTPSWADIDVPEGTDTIRIAWNKNFQDVDKTVFLKTALNTTEIVKLVDESASFPTAFQFQVDFDLSRIPALTCPSSSVLDSANLSAVYDRYDALVSAYPDYVTKVDCMSEANTALGLETPSELDGMNIYMYKFSPIRARGNSTAYSSDVGSRINVLLTTNHPNERFGLHTLFEVMNHICNDWATDVNADMLRSLIDIYVIPIPWPWDYVNNSRTNYNGVNPNRNFPTEGWAVSGAGTSDYTGAEPLSEYEAKVLAYFVAQIKPKVFLDVHTSGNDNAGCMGITERPSGKYSQYLRDLFGIAARTMSNRAIQDNTNYPSNPNNSIYGAYNMTTIGGLFQYVYEQGCIYSTISEQSDYSNWLNGVFQGTGSTHIEQRTNGIYRQQTQWLFNLILRMTFAACQRFYQFEYRI